MSAPPNSIARPNDEERVTPRAEFGHVVALLIIGQLCVSRQHTRARPTKKPYKTNRLRCLLSMNRRAIIIATCVFVVAGIVFVLASASGGRSGTPPRSSNEWATFTFTMPASNITAASQINISPQIK